MQIHRTAVWASALLLFWGAGPASAQRSQIVQILKGPTVPSATGNSATVTWTTNVDAGAVVKYGTDQHNLSQTAEAPRSGVTHQVNVHNLQPNTTYFYQVHSPAAQGADSGATSAIAQFKTPRNTGASGVSSAAPGEAPAYNPSTFQVIAGPIPQQVRATSVTLWWITNQSVTGSRVKYGTSPATLNQVAQTQSTDGLSNKSELTNLQPETTYYFNIVRPDGGTSASGTFKSGSVNAPAQSQGVQVTNGPVIERLAHNQAMIAWTTTVPASSVVRYGTAQGSLNQTAQADWTSGTHRVTLNNLQPNTKYWFQIQSAQAKGAGSTTTGGVYPFRTVQSGEAAMNVSPQF